MEEEIVATFNQADSTTIDKITILQRLQQLPKNIQPLGTQVAGHINGIFKDEKTKTLLKVVLDYRGNREKTFYEFIYRNRESANYTWEDLDMLSQLRSFTPTYLSTRLINGVSLIEMEDITDNLPFVSVMDIKMGRRTYDRNATIQKINQERKKSHNSAVLGYRILGTKVWNASTSSYTNLGRTFYNQINKFQVNEMLHSFLQAAGVHHKNIVHQFARQLCELGNWFTYKNRNRFEFVSSSLLFVYSVHGDQPHAYVRMIDFAHVFPLSGSVFPNPVPIPLDHNYLFGVWQLHEFFSGLDKSHTCSDDSWAQQARLNYSNIDLENDY